MSGSARHHGGAPRRLPTVVPIALVVVAYALTLLAPGCSINPATGKSQFSLVSESQEIQLGVEGDKGIQAEYGIYEDPELTAYVDRVGQKLAAVSERPDLEWHFRVIDSPVINAFALPGGYIYITRGILAVLNSEAQLAGVLGHEIGHVTARHGAQQMTRAQLAALGFGVGSAFIEGFRVVALQPQFNQPGVAPDVAIMFAWSLVLLVVTGGIAMLIGKVGDTFDETA